MSSNLNSYRIFYEAAVCGSFNNAALSLGVAPVTVSRAIRDLETELGAPLFTREGRLYSLTAEGQRLLNRIFSPMSILSSAEDSLRADAERESCEIRMGVSAAPRANLLLDRTLSPFLESHPGLHLSVRYHDVGTLFNQLCLRELDLVITEFVMSQNPHILAHPLYREPLVPVASPRFAERFGFRFAAARLAELPYIEPNPRGNVSALVSTCLKQAGLQLRPLLTVSNFSIQRRAVLLGHGFSFFPLDAVSDELRQGSLVLLKTDLPLPQDFVVTLSLLDDAGNDSAVGELSRALLASAKLQQEDLKALLV